MLSLLHILRFVVKNGLVSGFGAYNRAHMLYRDNF